MDGTDLGIGIAGLFVSVAVAYRTLNGLVERYGDCFNKGKNLMDDLESQRNLYRLNCERIFASIGQQWTQVLKDHQEAARGNPQLYRKIEQALGPSGEAYKRILRLIHADFCEIDKETQPLHLLLEEHSDGNDKTFEASIKQKLSFSFSLPRWTEMIEKLGKHIEALISTRKHLEAAASAPLPPSNPSAGAIASQLSIERHASNSLYKALSDGWTCVNCVDHTANLSLDVGVTESHTATKVKFELVIIFTRPSPPYKPLWLSIESDVRDHQAEPQASESYLAVQDATCSEGGRTQLRSAVVQRPLATRPSTSSSSTSGTDLHVYENLCRHFQRTPMSGNTKNYMGYLGCQGTQTRHSLFRIPPPIQQGVTAQPKSFSLKQLFIEAGGARPGPCYLWQKRVELARLLTLAVVRYHRTPWLSGSWSSGDILYVGEDIGTESGKLPESPRLRATLSNAPPPNGRMPNGPGENKSVEALFQLGVVLVELMHVLPIEDVKKSTQLRSKEQRQDFAAGLFQNRALEQNLNIHKMYKDIVIACLTCHFEHTVLPNLDDVAFQTTFLSYMTSRLEVIEQCYVSWPDK